MKKLDWPQAAALLCTLGVLTTLAIMHPDTALPTVLAVVSSMFSALRGSIVAGEVSE